MDPLTAFGLAVNILSVVDFSIKILSTASEIRLSGDTVNNSDKALVAEDLKACCLKLSNLSQQNLINNGYNSAAQVPKDDKMTLQWLASEAISIADDITSSLNSSVADISTWKSLRLAVLNHWNEKKMEEKTKRLETIRNELQFNIIISIKAQVDVLAIKENSSFQALDEQTKTIVKAILTGDKDTTDAFHEHTIILNKKLEENQKQLAQQFENSNSLATRYHQEQMNAIRTIPSRPAEVDELVHISMVTNRIRNALWFSKVNDRYDDIKTAYQDTFQWIFSGKNKQGSSSCTFMEWVEGSNGVYWVSGKAGAGKSTLMKYLAEDDRTHQAFENWANDNKLVTATYWFWDQAQDPIQKSLRGLYQALLHDIISKEPSFAPILFPDQYVSGREFRIWQDFPTDHELKRAFTRLVSITCPPAYISILIDGLDEFAAPESEHFELAEILKEAGRSKHMKIVVSSRPQTAFETSFKDCDKLRLHELTFEDQYIYTANLLLAQPRMSHLCKKYHTGEDAANALVSLVVEKSEGIFLWLILVVKSLAMEINECDDLSDLQRVLDRLPRGLENLFVHILQRIPEHRRNRGIQLISLVHRSLLIPAMQVKWIEKPITDAPAMTAIALSAAHLDITSLLERSHRELDSRESDDIIFKVDQRLRSHCAGLLEMKRLPPSNMPFSLLGSSNDSQENAALSDMEVSFLHRCVAEFLDKEEMWSDFSRAATTNFNIDLSLMKGYLMKLKTTQSKVISSHWEYVERILRLSQLVEVQIPSVVERLLDEVERIMTSIPRIWDGHVEHSLIGEHWTDHFPWDHVNFGEKVIGTWETPLPKYGNFLSFAIENGLEKYVITKLNQSGHSKIPKRGIPLLSLACRPVPFWVLTPGVIRPGIIAELLRLGADPNQEYESWDNTTTTPWDQALGLVGEFHFVSLRSAQQLTDILRVFIENGAYIKNRKAMFEIESNFITPFSSHPEPPKTSKHFGLSQFVPFEDVDAYTSYALWSTSSMYFDFRNEEELFSQRIPSPLEAKAIFDLGKGLLKLLKKKEAQSSTFGKLQTKMLGIPSILSKRYV